MTQFFLRAGEVKSISEGRARGQAWALLPKKVSWTRGHERSMSWCGAKTPQVLIHVDRAQRKRLCS